VSSCLKTEIGEGEPIRDEQIAKALVGTRLQAVVLSACEAEKPPRIPYPAA